MSDDLPEEGAPASPDLAALSVAAYEDLLKLARARLRSSGPFTLLDTAGLVSDCYKRLAQQHHLQIKSRAHFLSYCSRIMRSVVIDLVRERNAQRRGGGAQKITLSTALNDNLPPEEEPLGIDQALAELASLEPRLAKVVEMRYFGGYSEEEVAEALGVTTRTVQRDWQKARVILHSMLSGGD
jgi:RNA polymerase sigma factor (TIGR02999 family)